MSQPDAAQPQRVRAVINQSSGTADDESVIGLLEAAAAARNWHIQTCLVPGPQIKQAIDEAVRDEPHALIVGGGDGTIRTALTRVMGTRTALGIIPMGTMNFVAKDLGIPIPTADAVAALVTAATRQVDVGEVNGHLFFHSSAIGIVPTLAERRERIRKAAHWRERLKHLWGAIRTAATAQPLSLTLEHGGSQEHKRTYSVIIANNPLSSDPLTPYRRHVLDGGDLSVYLAHHTGRLGIARLLFTFGSGWWFWDRSIVEFKSRSLRIRARRKRIVVSNDGELDTLSLPLRYTIHTRAVHVLAPPVPPPEPKPAAPLQPPAP
jgi:diacylglycerol kinase family enzyme